MLEDIRVRMLLDKELWTDLNNEARRRAGFGADVTQTAIFAPDILSSPWCVGPPPVWMLAPASGSHNFCLSLTDHSTWNMVNRAQMIKILISGDIIELSLHVLFYMYWFIYSWQAVQCSTWKKKMPSWDFPSGPVVKNLPCNAGEMSSIPGWGTKIPHPCMPQWKILYDATETQHSQINKWIFIYKFIL